MAYGEPVHPIMQFDPSDSTFLYLMTSYQVRPSAEESFERSAFDLVFSAEMGARRDSKTTFNVNGQRQEVHSFGGGVRGLSGVCGVGWGVPVPAHSPAWGGADTKQTSLSGFLVFVEAREKEE